MNQEQKVLKHLKSQGSISGLEAWDLYRIRSLPRRIATLRKEGYLINGVVKHDATGQRYKRYFYEGVDNS